MNIFFNSRINANQSLLNVLFGQQQKGAFVLLDGCFSVRQDYTDERNDGISASGA